MLPDLESVQRVSKISPMGQSNILSSNPGKPVTCISWGEPKASTFPMLNADFTEKMWIRSHPHEDSNTRRQGAKAKDIYGVFHLQFDQSSSNWGDTMIPKAVFPG